MWKAPESLIFLNKRYRGCHRPFFAARNSETTTYCITGFAFNNLLFYRYGNMSWRWWYVATRAYRVYRYTAQSSVNSAGVVWRYNVELTYYRFVLLVSRPATWSVALRFTLGLCYGCSPRYYGKTYDSFWEECCVFLAQTKAIEPMKKKKRKKNAVGSN